MLRNLAETVDGMLRFNPPPLWVIGRKKFRSGAITGVALAEALEANRTLTALQLQCLSEAAGVALGEALRTNATLTTLKAPHILPSD